MYILWQYKAAGFLWYTAVVVWLLFPCLSVTFSAFTLSDMWKPECFHTSDLIDTGAAAFKLTLPFAMSNYRCMMRITQMIKPSALIYCWWNIYCCWTKKKKFYLLYFHHNIKTLWMVPVWQWGFCPCRRWQPVYEDQAMCTWVTVEGWVMLAVAAGESSGTAALVQAALRVLAGSSVLKKKKKKDNHECHEAWEIFNDFAVRYVRESSVTDLAGLVFAGGAAGHPRRAALQVFEDHFLSLDNQLTDAAWSVRQAAR